MGKTELLLTVILFNAFFAFFVIAILVYIRKYKSRKAEYENEIKIKNEIHQKELLSTQLEIQKETMQQIGRELHDDIGQKMTLVSMYTQQMIHQNHYPELYEKFRQINEIAKDSIKDLRSLSRSLTNDKITENSLLKLLEDEVHNANAINNCKVQLLSHNHNPQLNVMQKNVLLRIAQEFIQNSVKHSGCENITIDLNQEIPEILELKIWDDGSGFDKNLVKNDGIGLVNMENRAKIIGANFQLDTAPGEGTRIFIKLKL